MNIAIIGLFASEYPIGLANSLADSAQINLFLSKQNLEVRFPGETDLARFLQSHHLLNSRVNLHLVDYPKGAYQKKLGMARDLANRIRRIDPDIVHYQSASDPWVPLALVGLRKYPLVVTIHDARRHLGDGVPEISMNITNTLVTRMARQVIVHGREQASVLMGITHTPTRKIHIIPIGSFDIYSELAGEVQQRENHTVLFFGRLRPYKGLEVLLQAVPEIIENVPDARFIIAGSGTCPALEAAVAKNPQAFEIHNYYVEPEKVSALFQRAALVVQPYIEASQSGIVPIAYKHQRPVVATQVGSIPEVVDDGITGILVVPGDVQGLARAVTKLLQDEEFCQKLGRQAAEKLAHELSWEAIAEKTMTVYELALQENDHATGRQNNWVKG